jgi:four helix bundle protein
MERACRKLEIYRLGHELGVAVHRMTLELPDFERFEEGSQVRRSSKRVSACIVEGHTLRKYKLLYLNFLYRALASADETQEHLDYLRETGSLQGGLQRFERRLPPLVGQAVQIHPSGRTALRNSTLRKQEG